MPSPLEVFRKPHRARAFVAATLVDGVMVPGYALHATITCSVQRIGRTQAEVLTARGKRLSDFRRIYSAQRLPLSDEVVTGTVSAVPAEDSLIEDGTGLVIQFGEGKGQAGEVEIDGLWYEIAERHPMQNGVINHYQYLLYRVNKNDQNV